MDLINLSKLRRALIYIFILVLIFMVQSILIPLMPIAGVKAMIIPIAVVCIALFENASWGAFFGLFIGYWCDQLLPETTVMCMLLFSVMGFAVGLLGEFSLRKGLLTAFVLSVLAMLIMAFCQSFSILFFTSTRFWPVFKTCFLQVLWGVPFIFAIFYPCRAVAAVDMYIT